MHRSPESAKNTYNLKNCFGFCENDVDLSLWNSSSVMNSTFAPVEFQQNKPYRLALYVRPSQQRRVNRANASAIIKNTIEKQQKDKKIDKNNSYLTEEKSVKVRGKRKDNTKPVNVMLFDENTKPENESKRIKQTPEKENEEKNISEVEIRSTRKNVLKEVNVKPLTKTKQNKIRRSYERKCKMDKGTENIPEPPTEEIMKNMEMKKLSRTKPKKNIKEDQEFENWANNMNSAFDDVDKFELSISYD